MLNQRTTTVFHRTLYAGILQTVTLLKRNDDQQEGTVRAITLFDCRKKKTLKIGEQIQGGTTADHRTVWQIPKIELQRNGVAYLNSADRIVDNQNRYWQPEADTEIVIQLFENIINVACLRIDPPGQPVVVA